MAKQKSRLGKGLDALLPIETDSDSLSPGVTLLPSSSIQSNPHQPRQIFNEAEIAELANSIEEHGIIQPVVVAAGTNPGEYILVAGERRLQAAKFIGMTEIPAVIREATKQELLELALIENLQRTDLSPLESAEAFHHLAEDYGLSHAQIADRVGKSRTAITNTMRLLNLPVSVRKALAERGITEGHARALLSLATPQSQTAALQTILQKDLSVRQTETLVQKLSGKSKPQPIRKTSDPNVDFIEEQFRQQLGTKVTLNKTKKGGTLTIHFYSDEELESLLSKLGVEDVY